MTFRDCGSLFFTSPKLLKAALLPDALHPSPRGGTTCVVHIYSRATALPSMLSHCLTSIMCQANVSHHYHIITFTKVSVAGAGAELLAGCVRTAVENLMGRHAAPPNF